MVRRFSYGHFSNQIGKVYFDIRKIGKNFIKSVRKRLGDPVVLVVEVVVRYSSPIDNLSCLCDSVTCFEVIEISFEKSSAVVLFNERGMYEGDLSIRRKWAF